MNEPPGDLVTEQQLDQLVWNEDVADLGDLAKRLLKERDSALQHRDDYESVNIDQSILLREARVDRREARDVARNLLALLETYLRLDVAAPKRIRDEAAAAREKIEGWEEKNG